MRQPCVLHHPCCVILRHWPSNATASSKECASAETESSRVLRRQVCWGVASSPGRSNPPVSSSSFSVGRVRQSWQATQASCRRSNSHQSRIHPHHPRLQAFWHAVHRTTARKFLNRACLCLCLSLTLCAHLWAGACVRVGVCVCVCISASAFDKPLTYT